MLDFHDHIKPEGRFSRKYPFWHSLSGLPLGLIIAGLCAAFPAVSEAMTATGGTTTTCTLTYVNGVKKWVMRIDPLNVQSFQLDIIFDPARAQLDQAVGLNGVVYKFPFSQSATSPDFTQVASGRLQDVAGTTSNTSPGDVDIFELVFIDLQPGAPINGVPFTVFASSNDSIVGFDPATMQTVIFDAAQIASTTRTVTPGVAPHIWDPDTQYNNGTTGGPGTWDTTLSSWDDLPLAPQPLTDTPWNNATHANDIAVFGGNPGSGIVTVSVPISAGGFQFDISGYNIQGGTITLSAPPGATPTIDTGANNATISSTISGSSGLTKIGPGTLVLGGANNYTGGTMVNAGTLLVNNSSGSGTGNSGVIVGPVAVLGGTGMISGPVDVHTAGPVLGGAVQGGDGTTASGALTIANSLTCNSGPQGGGIIKIALGPSGAHSTLTRAGGTWTFADSQAFTFIDLGAQPGLYDNIITGLAADPGGVASWQITNPGFAGTFTYDGAGNIDLNLTAVQHPVVQLMTAVSRKLHGSAGPFDINLPLNGQPGLECRSSGSNHQLTFTFNSNVVSGSASVMSGTGSVLGNPTFSGNTMTVNLTGVADAQYITVNLTNVTDSTGDTLSAVPVTMGVLLGDSTGNGAVSNTDVASVKAQVAAPVTASNFRNDVNANGVVSNTDISITKAQVGSSLP
jgi:autotransporter-associated beta strand protein